MSVASPSLRDCRVSTHSSRFEPDFAERTCPLPKGLEDLPRRPPRLHLDGKLFEREKMPVGNVRMARRRSGTKSGGQVEHMGRQVRRGARARVSLVAMETERSSKEIGEDSRAVRGSDGLPTDRRFKSEMGYRRNRRSSHLWMKLHAVQRLRSVLQGHDLVLPAFLTRLRPCDYVEYWR